MRSIVKWWLKTDNRDLRLLVYTFAIAFSLFAVAIYLENALDWFAITFDVGSV